MPKKEKEAKPKYVEAIEYEKYCDLLFTNYKKGVFALCFAQGIDSPPKLLVRIWTDAGALKIFVEGLREIIKEYEKEHGKIE